MLVIAIDPGYRESARVTFDGARIMAHAIEDNATMLGDLAGSRYTDAVLVLEQMQLFSGYGVGQEVFDAIFWAGRFAQAWHPRRFEQLLRSKIRGHLGASKGGDAAVRQALIARFGPYKDDAIGTKKHPGSLFGIHADEWSALAIAVTWWDLHMGAVPTLAGTRA